MRTMGFKRLFVGALLLVFYGCMESNDGCKKACEKCVSLAKEEAESTLDWWHRLPEDFRSDARETETEWRMKFADEKVRFLDACTNTCNDGARASVIECRRRALSTSEWIRCADK